jgi:transcription initiation factor TFIIIB Brf1 subunit/transcription initiation factor TFIIB
LNLTKDVRKVCEFIINKIRDVDKLSGRSPNSIAATAIFWAAELTGNLRTAEEIGKII